jgi:hypothetical protein
VVGWRLQRLQLHPWWQHHDSGGTWEGCWHHGAWWCVVHVATRQGGEQHRLLLLRLELLPWQRHAWVCSLELAGCVSHQVFCELLCCCHGLRVRRRMGV